MKKLTAIYDGFELTKYCKLLKVRKLPLPEIKNEFTEIDTVNGGIFKKRRYGRQVVELEIGMILEVNKLVDELNLLLDQREPKPLIISDQPDRKLMCVLKDFDQPDNRFHYAKSVLTFESPDYYWSSTEEEPTVTEFNLDGRALVENKGSAPTKGLFEFNFLSDCGFLSIVSPNGHFTTGNPAQLDGIKVPDKEKAVNEELHEVSKWTKLGNIETYIPDYNKISSKENPTFDKWGILINPAITATTDQWHGHAYVKDFKAGVAETVAVNFRHKSRIHLIDRSGTVKNTCAMLILITDAENNPIMSVSMYDVTSDRNEIVCTFKVPSGEGKRSKIIHTAKMSHMSGFVQMSKQADELTWHVYNEAYVGAKEESVQLKVGDIVYLKPTATTIYDWNGKALKLSNTVKGQPMKVTGIRNTPRGKYKLSNVRYGYVEGFFDASSIKTAPVPRKVMTTQPVEIKHTMKIPKLATVGASRVFIWQGKWGATKPYTKNSLESVVIDRVYDTDFLDQKNTFETGDEFVVDCDNQVALLNGKTFEGKIEYDSRFFDIDGGQTELALLKSDWATMPKGIVKYESRWF